MTHPRCAGRPTAALALATSALLTGCGEPALTAGVVAGATVGTIVLGTTPGPELKQVFYLGSFDPQGQLPPEVYRITVRGQASLVSSTTFASGWVPASVADALGAQTSISSRSGDVTIRGPAGVAVLGDNELGAGRRLVLFGPDGFRVAPRNHRLVIVMGADADDYFNAIDDALGDLGRLHAANDAAAVSIHVARHARPLDHERRHLSATIEQLQAHFLNDLEARLAHEQAKGSPDE